MRTTSTPRFMPLFFVLAGMTTAVAGGCEEEDGLFVAGGPDSGRLDGAARDGCGGDRCRGWPCSRVDVGTGNDVARDAGEDLGGLTGTDVASESGPSDAGSAQCQQGAVRSFASSTEAVQAMAGRWKYCGGSAPSAFKDEAIEFTAGGQWFQLEPDATGALVRQMSPERPGSSP